MAAVASALLLAGCGEGWDYADEDEAASYADGSTGAYGGSSYETSSYDRYGSDAESARPEFDEDAARQEAEDELAGDSYVGVGMPYSCTEDCSGHEAGYRYRADNGYVGYNADSRSFNEGGQAFEDAVEDRVEEMRGDYESGGAPY